MPDWMEGPAEDAPIDPTTTPDVEYGRILDQAVNRLRHRECYLKTVASPPGFEPGFQP